jgi:nitroreductase
MKNTMETEACILGRKSIRNFNGKQINGDDIIKILEAARWAPSGKNKQPWRFYVIQNRDVLNKISRLTEYYSWMKQASTFIAVYLDRASSYDEKKDMHGIGAAIQNMLLMAHDRGISCCWNGEIIANEQKVNELLNAPDNLELMAVIAMGYTDTTRLICADRLSLDTLVVNWIK